MKRALTRVLERKRRAWNCAAECKTERQQKGGDVAGAERQPGGKEGDEVRKAWFIGDSKVEST